MTIDVSTLLAPISDPYPAGEDARENENYEAVAAEIEKLTSLSAATPINWALVADQGADILRSQSKDFMLCAWVSAAWIEAHGIDGLSAGLTLHAGLMQRYWDNGFPPLKRLRGRRNALSWWVDRASEWLSNQTLAPLQQDAHAAIVTAAQAIDDMLAEKDPDAPPLASFVRQLKNLDVVAPIADGDSPAKETAADPAPDQPPPPPPTQAAPATLPTGAKPAAPVTLPDSFTSIDDIVGALSPLADHLGQLSGALMTLDRFHPLVVEIGRFAARAPLLEPPPAQGGTTALVPPPVAIIDAFQAICHAGNAEGIIEFCESRILAFPFWLDLDQASARGFGMLGERGARMRKAIIKNALAFTERMPGIELLTFADGTPFASEETRQWLETCRAEQSGNAPTDAFGAVQQQAQQAGADGRHDDAIKAYQSFIQTTSTGRDQFKARLALTDLFITVRADADPVPFVQPLVEDCTQHALNLWEPELASKAWQIVLKACRQALAASHTRDDPSKRERYLQLQTQALQALARVDFTAATRYGA